MDTSTRTPLRIVVDRENDICKDIEENIDALTITAEGRKLHPDELTRDELIELVHQLNRYILYRCNCKEKLKKIV